MTKFYHVRILLPEDIACDVITEDVKKYDDLKQAVIRHLKANRHQLIERALSAIELCDKRPSQLVYKVKRLLSEIGLRVAINSITNKPTFCLGKLQRR